MHSTQQLCKEQLPKQDTAGLHEIRR